MNQEQEGNRIPLDDFIKAAYDIPSPPMPEFRETTQDSSLKIEELNEEELDNLAAAGTPHPHAPKQI